MSGQLRAQETTKTGESEHITGTALAGDKHALDVNIPGTISGTFSPSGLNVAGLHTLVSINDATWTALPAMALSDRNAISIQNNTGFEMKVNYTTGGGYVGMTIADGAERSYDIKDTIVIYGRLEAGAGTLSVDVEELS